jgi:hypothetical protein
MWVKAMCTKFGFILVVLLVVGPSTEHGELDTGKVTLTPDEAIRQLAKVANAQDYAGVLATFAEAPRKAWEKVDDATSKLVKARKNLSDAMDKKFGKQANQSGAEARDDKGVSLTAEQLGAAAFANAELVGKNMQSSDRVQLKVRVKPNVIGGKEHDIDMIAVKEREAWKLIPPHFDPVEYRTFAHFLLMQEAAIKKITEEVKEGRYPSRDEASWAMSQAIKKAAQKMAKERSAAPKSTPKEP